MSFFIQFCQQSLDPYISSPQTIELLSRWLAALLVLSISIISFYMTRRILLPAVQYFVKKTPFTWDDTLLEHHVFDRLSHLTPAIIITFFAAYFPTVSELITRLVSVYMMIVGLAIVSSLIAALLEVSRSIQSLKDKPLRGYAQMLKLFIFIIGSLFIASTLMNRDPWMLLSGIGALTAVLLLVFKDTILGLVASIQLSVNDMVRRGDWLEMPKYGADGDVIEVALHTIKVQNWDKTITTIPTQALIGDSFKNWRGMSESGGRRIKRSIQIDMNSISFCDDELLNRFGKFHFLKNYISSKRSEVDQYNQKQDLDFSQKINGRRLTNIGCFRAYVVAYLRQHPKIHDEMTFLVRHLSPTSEGLPIEIYVFSNDQDWVNYEGIQADIFDHILATIPEFGLRVFQNPVDWILKA